MISISERLRARQEPVGDGSGRWRKDGLCQEAADTIDALVAVAEIAKIIVARQVREDGGIDNCDIELRMDLEQIDAALSMAKAYHTGNSARGNAMKDEA